MKTLPSIVGVLLILTGIVWFFQGINVLPGSFMTGQIEYAYAGAGVALAGAGLIAYSRRKRGAPPADESEEQE